MSTLLDSVTGLAVLTRPPIGSLFVSVELKVNFISPISTNTGMLLAKGRVVDSGSRIATSEAHFVDSEGKLYAHGTATWTILRNAT